MTTLAQAKELLYAEFVSVFAAAHPTVQIFADNEKAEPTAGQPFVRIAVRHAFRTQDSMGGSGQRKFRSSGFFVAQVFSPPLDEGSQTADNLAATAQLAMEGKTLTGVGTVHTNSATITEIGDTNDWYQINVSASFFYDETK